MTQDQNNFNPAAQSLVKAEAMYKNARVSLLMVAAFSFINIITICFADSYFLFSSYVTQMLSYFGAYFYVETGEILFYIVFAVLALVSVIPYLVCWIFSKKYHAPMIIALVLFSLDTAFMLFNIIGYFDFSMILDVVFHAYVIYSLATGVKFGKQRKALAEEVAAMNAAQAQADAEAASGDVVLEDSPEAQETRVLSFTRNKSFYGSAVAFSIYVDNQVVATIRNGETVSVTVNGLAHQLAVNTSGGAFSNVLELPAGSEGKSYLISGKLMAKEQNLKLEEIVAEQSF
jgi:hypothetical protein